MYQTPSRTQLFLERLAGPGLLGAISFMFLVLLGVVYLPGKLVAVVVLWVYHALLWLHERGRYVAVLTRGFLDPERNQF